MASIKDLKKRIGTVKNTQQTTKAMKMVSASKLRRAQEAITSQRPYAKAVGELIKLALRLSNQKSASTLLNARELPDGEKKKAILLLVTSDRGLCGGFNALAIKTAQRWLIENEKKYGSVRLSFVGKKGFEFFRNRRTNNDVYFEALGGKPSFQKAKKLALALIEKFQSGEADEIFVVYNEFVNAAVQQQRAELFLPLAEGVSENAAHSLEAQDPPYLSKPSAVEVLDLLLGKHFQVQAFRMLLESQASEHGARMSAMENATKNAGEMIKKLTLQYNKQRQASITKELLEIISGSESQKAS